MVENCKHCGKFHSNKTYCSRDCQYEDQRNTITLECRTCGEEFEEVPSRVESGRGKHCSFECRKREVVLECAECGDEFSPKPSHTDRRKYCSTDCMAEAYRLPKAIRDDTVYGPLWRDRRWEAIARDNFECQECGMTMSECRDEYDTGLHVHHIIPYREFDSDEKAHQLSNLLTLCPSCHHEEERKT